jgi:maltooligosyltrehalose trehalohydrolase
MNQTIKVWAPYAQKVELVSYGGQEKRYEDMQGHEDGWWRLSTMTHHRPHRYKFRLDETNEYPDPCSLFQPDGIEGPSELIDHQAYDWHDANWRPPALERAIIYELHVGTFSRDGTFLAAIGYLDHLAELGVTHIELLPVHCFSGDRGWGYDGAFPFSPHPAYGRPDDLKTLIDACHQRGLAVIMDVVYNHFGPQGNYFGKFGPYLTDRYHTPWGQAMNFDDRLNHHVRQMVIDNVRMWLMDYHCDGLRFDAIHTIYDKSATHILEEINRNVEHLRGHTGKHFITIAESDLNDPKVVRSRDAWGYGFDSQWNDDFHHAIHAYFTKESQGYYQDYGQLEHIVQCLTKGFVHDGSYSTFRQSYHGRPWGSESARKLITYIQNHDQVGNRARGDRLSQQLSWDQLKLAATLSLLAPSTPMIFQGEEWGSQHPFCYFTDHQDPKLAKAVRQGRRREFEAFGWRKEDIPDPQSEDTFMVSKLDWEAALDGEMKVLMDWYRQLLHIRQTHLATSCQLIPAENCRFSEEDDWLFFCHGGIGVALNFSKERRGIPSPFPFAEPTLLAASKGDLHHDNNMVSLPAFSTAIFRTEAPLYE